MGNNRNDRITRTSIVGIVANLLLSAFKLVVGLVSNSVAVVLDAVNNIADALSSAITIVGVRLAGRKPDRKHPFGYGRIEYFSAIIISAVIFAAGVSSLVESVKAIFHPEITEFTLVSLSVIAVALVGKLILGRYFVKQGEKLNSDALVATGTEASYDAILSGSTIFCAAASMIWGVSIDGFVGLIISAFIIKTGIEMLLDPLGKVVGNRLQGELSQTIKQRIKEVPGVNGVYDLVLHDYGPEKAIGSVHVEVSDTLTPSEIQIVTRSVAALVYSEFKAVVTVGIYVSNDSDPGILKMKKLISDIVLPHDGVKQMHGFFTDGDNIVFDIVVAFDHDADAICRSIEREITKIYPDKLLNIVVDTDYSD